MARKFKRSPLALAVLALLHEEPMHPYRMQRLIKDRGKDQVINVERAGTTILTADNTHSGLTTIAAGTLQLGAGGTTGSIVGDVLSHWKVSRQVVKVAVSFLQVQWNWVVNSSSHSCVLQVRHQSFTVVSTHDIEVIDGTRP